MTSTNDIGPSLHHPELSTTSTESIITISFWAESCNDRQAFTEVFVVIGGVMPREERSMRLLVPCRVCSRAVYVTLVIACFSTLQGCGGSCRYDDVHGTCTITSWEEVEEGADSIDVTFDFVPNDSDEESETDAVYYLSCGDHQCDPSREWLEEVGMTVGSSHRCTRQVIRRGSCTPVMYSFDDIDEDVD